MPAPSKFQKTNKLKLFNRLAQIILAITFIAGLNYLSVHHYVRKDISKGHLYSLSAETKAYLNEINEPVRVIATLTESEDNPVESSVYRYLKRLLEEYQHEAKRRGKVFEVEFVDVLKQRGRAAQLANEYGLQEQKIVLVTSGDKKRLVSPKDLITSDGEQIKGFKGEQAISSALVSVIQAKSPTIYFIVGHGEMRIDDVSPQRGLSQIRKELAMRNFNLLPLDLTKDETVPEDADMLVLAAPQSTLLPEEVARLRTYLNERAGKVLALLEPGREHGLDDLLYEWGILVDDAVIIDTGSDYLASGGDLIIRQLAKEHPVTTFLVENQIPVLVGLTRPARPDLGSPIDERRIVTPLLGSSTSSWGERAYRSTETIAFNPNIDIKGPVPIATVAERKVSSQLGINIPGGKLAVFGTADFLANTRLGRAGNQILALNTINWMLEQEQHLNIPPRPIDRFQITMSRSEIEKLGLRFLAVPFFAIFFGMIVIWIRKR